MEERGGLQAALTSTNKYFIGLLRGSDYTRSVGWMQGFMS